MRPLRAASYAQEPLVPVLWPRSGRASDPLVGVVSAALPRQVGATQQRAARGPRRPASDRRGGRRRPGRRRRL